MARATPPLLLAAALAIGPAPAALAQTVTLNTGGRDVRITVGEAAALPGDFPPDVPLPDGYALVQVQHAGDTTTIEADVPGELDAVAARLGERLQAEGWRPARVGAPPAGRAQAWEKDRRAVVAWLKPAAAGVRMQLQLRPRR